MEPIRPHHRRLQLVARDVPHLPGVIRHELLVEGLADRGGEIVGERAFAELRQLFLDQLLLVVSMLVQLAMNGLAFGHLVDVLVVNRVPVLPAVGLDVRKQPAVDVEQFVVRQPGDGVVDRILFAARPEPDVRAEFIRVAGVVAGPRQPADPAVLFDEGDFVSLFSEVIGHRRAGHAAAEDQNLLVHAAILNSRSRYRTVFVRR
jgi:hypothetical protein